MLRKRSQAVMALFFRQVEAAIEPRSAFETAVELNPQIGREIKVLARSPRLLPGLACIRRSVDHNLRRRYVEQATRLHEQTTFRQTFLVLRVTRLVPWDPRFLDTARALTARHEALRRKAGLR
jgi:ABC-type phosphate/phosphonate transport system substrate-binding protein